MAASATEDESVEDTIINAGKETSCDGCYARPCQRPGRRRHDGGDCVSPLLDRSAMGRVLERQKACTPSAHVRARWQNGGVRSTHSSSGEGEELATNAE